MKDAARNRLLLAGAILPLVLLLWPFAQWGEAMSLLFRVLPALSGQALLCQVGKHPVVRVTPLVFTGLLALWGAYLYCTSPHWSHAALGGFIADYVSPFLGCAAVYVLSLRPADKKP